MTEILQSSELEDKTVLSSTELAVDTICAKLLEPTVSKKEKPRGRIRGALIPIGAAALTFAGRIAGIKAVENIINTVPYFTNLSNPAVAAALAAGGSLFASGVERTLGGSAFSLFSRYSHIEGGGKLVKAAKIASPPIGIGLEVGLKGWRLYARGAERLVLKRILFPSNVDRLSEGLNSIKIDQEGISSPKFEKLLGKSFFYLTAYESCQKFGAYFSDSEKEQLKANVSKIHNSLESVFAQLTNIPDYDRAKLLDKIVKRYKKIESGKYLLEAGGLAIVGAAKAALFEKIFELIFKAAESLKILPALKNNAENSQLNPQTQTQEVTVSNPQVVSTRETTANHYTVTRPETSPVNQPLTPPNTYGELMPRPVSIGQPVEVIENPLEPITLEPQNITSSSGVEVDPDPDVLGPVQEKYPFPPKPKTVSQVVESAYQSPFTTQITPKPPEVSVSKPALPIQDFKIEPIVPDGTVVPVIQSSEIPGAQTLTIENIESARYVFDQIPEEVREQFLTSVFGKELAPNILAAWQAGGSQLLQILSRTDPRLVLTFITKGMMCIVGFPSMGPAACSAF